MARSDPPDPAAGSGLQPLLPPDGDPGGALDQASEALRPYLKDASRAPQLASAVVSVMRLHIGPLPPPEILDGYERSVPGAGTAILEMAVSEQRHRHALERAASRYPFVGLAAGFCAFILCVAASVYLARLGQPIVAGLLVGAPLISAIGWFINGRQRATHRQADDQP